MAMWATVLTVVYFNAGMSVCLRVCVVGKAIEMNKQRGPQKQLSQPILSIPDLPESLARGSQSRDPGSDVATHPSAFIASPPHSAPASQGSDPMGRDSDSGRDPLSLPHSFPPYSLFLFAFSSPISQIMIEGKGLCYSAVVLFHVLQLLYIWGADSPHPISTLSLSLPPCLASIWLPLYISMHHPTLSLPRCLFAFVLWSTSLLSDKFAPWPFVVRTSLHWFSLSYSSPAFWKIIAFFGFFLFIPNWGAAFLSACRLCLHMICRNQPLSILVLNVLLYVVRIFFLALLFD